jgi:chromosome segregation ATPase
MDQIEIPKTEYAELQKRPSTEELAAEKRRADEAVERAERAERDLERIETEKKRAEDELADAKRKVEAAEEEREQSRLRDDRLGVLGEGFMEKLGETAKKRLRDQAGVFSDEDWRGRLEELSELTGVAPDADKDGKPAERRDGGEEFSRREIARAGAGAGGSENGGGGEQPRRSVVASLMGGDPDKSND